MIRTIEVHSNGIIQKVFNHKGELVRYQAGIAGNSKALTACSSLHEARAILGIMPPPVIVKPKRKNHGKNTKAQAEKTE